VLELLEVVPLSELRMVVHPIRREHALRRHGRIRQIPAMRSFGATVPGPGSRGGIGAAESVPRPR
jgi:hypothetical protein